MNREIKFRVWDIELSIWINNIAMGKDNVLTKGTGKRFAIMQYTGLKDRNGKEIFEGDILKEKYSDGSGERIIVVEYGFSSSTHMDSEYIYGFQIGGHTDSEFEVIGNLHETPELLNN